MRPEQRPIPDWARREREADLVWLAENLSVFWTTATVAFEGAGRGAIVVDITSLPIPGAGHPFGYFPQEQIEAEFNVDTRHIVSEYDPAQELVVVLLKPGDRVSTYRLMTPETDELGWDFRYLQDREAALAEATEENAHQLLAGAQQLEAEGAPEAAQELRNDAELILQRLDVEQTPAKPELKPPDLETLIAWEADGGCEAACPEHCWIEPDGTCPHGRPSWLLKLGLI